MMLLVRTFNQRTPLESSHDDDDLFGVVLRTRVAHDLDHPARRGPILDVRHHD
jgi:hypothetical protein